MLRSGKRVSDVHMGIRQPGHGLRWILLNSEPMFNDTDRTPFAVVSTFTDDTVRCLAEEALRHSESELKAPFVGL